MRLQVECDACQVEWEVHQATGIDTISGRWSKRLNAPITCSAVYLGAFPEADTVMVRRLQVAVDGHVARDVRDARPGQPVELDVVIGRC